MATLVSSIGSGGGRDYSTLQAWEDACSANLVADGNIWKGEACNDSEFTASLSVSGITQDASNYVWLTAAAGQSFQDHANVRTNALRYNQSNGVGIRRTNTYVNILSLGTTTRLSRVQVEATALNSNAVTLSGDGRVWDCIIQGNCQGNGNAQYWINCLFAYPNGGGFTSCQKSVFIGCTAVNPSDRSTSSYWLDVNGYSSPVTLTSCAVFGFTNITDDNTQLSGCTFNVTSASSFPGTNNTTGATFSQTEPFVDADKDSFDGRAASGSSLAGAGDLDATNAPNDISGTVRVDPPTCGCWELGSAHVSGADDKRATDRGFNRGMDRGIAA